MKKLYLLSIFAMMLSLTSCEWSTDKNDAAKQENTTGNSDYNYNSKSQDTVQQKKMAAVKNSLYSDLKNNINELKGDVNDNKKGIDEVKERLDNDSRQFWNILTIVAIILSLLSMSFTWLTSKQCIDYDQAKGLIGKLCNKEFHKIGDRLNLIESKLSNRHIGSNTSLTPNISIEEIETLKKRIEAIEKDVNTRTLSTIPDNKLSDSSYGKVGYAKFSTQGYFTEILPIKDPGCIYKFSFKGENNAEFSLISLSLLRQSPEWKNVVETTGSCKIDEAQDFKELSQGVCEKEQGAWRVTKKLKIEIRK